MSVPQLTDAECDTLLTAHPEWSIARDGKAIERKFQFSDFSEAWGFMKSLLEKYDYYYQKPQ